MVKDTDVKFEEYKPNFSGLRNSVDTLNGGLDGVAGRLDDLLFLLRSKPDESLDYFNDLKQHNNALTRKHFNENKRLLALEFSVSEKICSCGKHRGVLIKDEEILLEDSLCPIKYWLKLAWQAHENNQKGFADKIPLNVFLERFKI